MSLVCPPRTAGGVPVPGPLRPGTGDSRPGSRPQRLLWPVAVYVASRLVLVALAALVAAVAHRGLLGELTQFDGQWYLRAALHGYPSHALHVKSTLGFLPAYPLAIRGVAWITRLSPALSAVSISLAGGLVAAVLAERLATSWWGPKAGRRAVLALCFFPGSVVFSMAYSEGLTLPLLIGCLLALGARRYVLAGLLAGLATAVEPIALVLIPICALAAGAALHRRGLADRTARRSLAAPLLAPLGIGAFAVFLWAWTGTPFAALLAQHYGWHEQGQPLAALALPVMRHVLADHHLLLERIASWNLWNGILGGAFLAVSLWALWRQRNDFPFTALVLPVTVAIVTVLSVMTPPNARMLLVAFPAVLVWVRRLSGPGLAGFAVLEVAFFLGASALTFSGHMLP